tara:strand:+ start:3859 stop:4377 length:519 start_codon:yes stop_codon:yes gene_type:complete
MNVLKISKHHQRGASMIEVLVTIFILAIGLLGAASLQSTGLRQAAMSQMSAEAQIQVQSLVEMIIAFDMDIGTGTPIGNYEYSALPGDQGVDCGATYCSKQQLAQYNIWNWADSMDPALPSFAFDIDFDDPNDEYSITFTWDSLREGPAYTASTCTPADGLNPGCIAILLEL